MNILNKLGMSCIPITIIIIFHPVFISSELLHQAVLSYQRLPIGNINNIKMMINLDTGAQLNVMPLNEFKKFNWY